MKSILSSCDAQLFIGSDHVMRCRTLARELQQRGAVAKFLQRQQSGNMISQLNKELAVLRLNELTLLASKRVDSLDLYRAWLGCNQEQDAASSLQAKRSTSIKNVYQKVINHYAPDENWEYVMLEDQKYKAKLKLMTIGGLAGRHHRSNVLLDQNFIGETTEQRYKDLVSSQ